MPVPALQRRNGYIARLNRAPWHDHEPLRCHAAHRRRKRARCGSTTPSRCNARCSASATRRRSRMFDRGAHDALRSQRPRRDPHGAEREEGRRLGRASRPATRRSASARRRRARMERFTRPLMQQYGVRLIIGKGGLGAAIARRVRRARRRLSRDHRRHRGAGDDMDRGDRGRRPRRPQSREPVAVSHPRFRPAARGDGQRTAAACTRPSTRDAAARRAAGAERRSGVKPRSRAR